MGSSHGLRRPPHLSAARAPALGSGPRSPPRSPVTGRGLRQRHHDTFHIALQSTREAAAAEMVYHSLRQGTEKDHPGNCSDHSLPWSQDKQFC